MWFRKWGFTCLPCVLINKLIGFVVPSPVKSKSCQSWHSSLAYLSEESPENFGSPCISNLRCWKITQFVLYFTHVSQILSPDRRDLFSLSSNPKKINCLVLYGSIHLLKEIFFPKKCLS